MPHSASLSQVEEKSSELDKVRNKVNQLESSSKSSSSLPPAKPNILVSSKHCQTDSSSLSADGVKIEPRVTFDLGPGSKPAAPAAIGAELRRPTEKPPSQLPSDARQRLQEMAGLDVRRNYRKTSETFRPNQLNLTAAYAAPINTTPSSSASTAASNSNNNSSVVAAVAKLPTAGSNAHVSSAVSTAAGRISPTKAYPMGAVMPTAEPNNHQPHHNFKSSNGGGGGGGGGGPTTAALMRKDSRSSSSANPRNSLVTVQNISNNQKRPHGGAVVSTREVMIMNNPPRNAINGNRTRTPSVERSIISTKDDPKDANKVRPKSFWGGWWKF